MKFTWLEKEERKKRNREKLSKWHKKFAWFPTRLSNDKTKAIWLEFMLRRAIWKYNSYNGKYYSQYQYLESEFDLLANPEWNDNTVSE